MFTQKSIKIFHSVQEIRPFSLFQNLALGKASTDGKCDFCNSLTFFRIWTSAKTQPISSVIWQSHGVRLVNIIVYAQFHHNIPLSSRDSTIITFFRIWSSAKSRPMKNVILQSLGLDLVNMNVCATVYQNSPFSLRDRAIFTFFRIWRSAKPRPMINVILQFLELDLVNINVSANFYQNIPNDERVKFHCFQNLNLGKTSTNPKCHLTISLATSCQYQCICKISSQYSTQFKR